MNGISSAPEFMLFNTVRLSIIGKDDSYQAIGTGFLFVLDVGKGNNNQLLFQIGMYS
jgi:hypothetical protein